MSKIPNKHLHPTLCFDCRNATKDWACPWVRNYTPVKGWNATKDHVGKPGGYGFDSYHVWECPMFKRDSFGGGTVEDKFSRKEKVSLDDEGTKALATAIINQYVEDWKWLDYGELDGITFRGSKIYRYDIIRFFGSAWFQDLLLATGLEVSTDEVCAALKITKKMIAEVFD